MEWLHAFLLAHPVLKPILIIATGFGYHPLLLIVPLILFAAFFETKRFSVPPLNDAFSAGTRGKRFLAGCMAGLLLSKTFIAAYLLGLQRHLALTGLHEELSNAGAPAAMGISVSVIAILFGLFFVMVLWPASMDCSLKIGFLLETVLGIAIYYCIIAYPAETFGSEQAANPATIGKVLWYYVDVPLFVLSLAFIINYRNWWPTSAISVCLFLSILLGIYTSVAYWTHSLVFIMLCIPVTLWLLKGFVTNNFPFQCTPGGKIAFPKERAIDPPPIDSDAAADKAKKESAVPGIFLPDGTRVDMTFKSAKKPLIIMVTTTGGGISAAVWTVAVLNRLTRDNKEVFTQNLRVISGASGGMVGAAFFVKNWADQPKPETPGLDFLAPAYRGVSKDHLEPVVGRLVFHDALYNTGLFPVPNQHDRGRALEESFSKAWGGNVKNPNDVDITLASLAQKESQKIIPSLVFTPMIIENGQRLFLGNLDLSKCFCSGGYLVRPNGEVENQTMSASAMELRLLSKDVYNSLFLSTAARMNASYPFISPAGILEGDFIPLGATERQKVLANHAKVAKAVNDTCKVVNSDDTVAHAQTNAQKPAPASAVCETEHMRLRIGDAGYYDNLGVNIASRWLLQYKGFFGRRLIEGGDAPKILMIQIRVTPNRRDGLLFARDKSSWISRAFEWLTSPPEAVYTSLFQSMQYHNDENIEDLSTHFGTNFATAILECPEKMPLSWALNEKEIDAFENWAYAGAKDNSDLMDELLRLREERAEDLPKTESALAKWRTNTRAAIQKWFDEKLESLTAIKENAAFLEEQFQGIHAFLKKI